MAAAQLKSFSDPQALRASRLVASDQPLQPAQPSLPRAQEPGEQARLQMSSPVAARTPAGCCDTV